MKPPRIYTRGGFFWIRYFEKGRKNEIRRTTGIAVDNSEWKKSRHRQKLQSLLKDVEFAREATTRGYEVEIKHSPGWWDLLDEYNMENADRRDRALAVNTIERRANALTKLLKFTPRIYPAQCNESFAKSYRAWLKERVSAWTARGYFNDIKGLLQYAKSRNYISENGFEGIQIIAEPGEPSPLDRDTLERVLVFTYQKKRGLFLHIATELLTGIRGEDCCNLLAANVNRGTFLFRNSKGRRTEIFPISEALNLVWQNSMCPEFILPYRGLRTVNYYLKYVREYLNLTIPLTSHSFKDSYAQSVARRCSDPRLLDLLLHHRPTVNKTAQEHYLRADVGQLREILNTAFADLEPFLESLPAQPDDGKKYRFANHKNPLERKVKQ